MIKWVSTAITTPKADKEIIAKNPLAPIGYNSASKQCRVMRFHKDFSEQKIKEVMLSDNFSLWTYTEGTSDDQYEIDARVDHLTSEQFHNV